MTKCDICNGQIPNDGPNFGVNGNDVCFWCEEIYSIAKFDIEKAKKLEEKRCEDR